MTTSVVTRTVYVSGVDLNVAQNTALLTFVCWRPIRLIRYGVIADSANGLLTAGALKLRVTPVSTGTAADVGTLADQLLNCTTVARGLGVVKTVGGQVTVEGRGDYEIPAGDTVTVCVETAAGGASSGHVFLEYEEMPFTVGYDLCDNLVESA